MARAPTILQLAGAFGLALGLGLAACGKKYDPRSATGVDRYPVGHPAGAPPGPAAIFRKPSPN